MAAHRIYFYEKDDKLIISGNPQLRRGHTFLPLAKVISKYKAIEAKWLLPYARPGIRVFIKESAVVPNSKRKQVYIYRNDLLCPCLYPPPEAVL